MFEKMETCIFARKMELVDPLLYFFGLLDAPPPPIWEENGGVSYSTNVAYIYIGEILCYLCY